MRIHPSYGRARFVGRETVSTKWRCFFVRPSVKKPDSTRCISGPFQQRRASRLCGSRKKEDGVGVYPRSRHCANSALSCGRRLVATTRLCSSRERCQSEIMLKIGQHGRWLIRTTPTSTFHQPAVQQPVRPFIHQAMSASVWTATCGSKLRTNGPFEIQEFNVK